MRVLIIPEDVRLDQYMLKPLFTAMMAHLGKPRAIVEVCQNPRFQGVSQVLKWENVEKVLKQWPQVDLFIICVDRDGIESREAILQNLEDQAQLSLSKTSQVVLGTQAWQEIEVWLLAGFRDLPKEWKWAEVRSERDPKEAYFYPYAEQRRVMNSPAKGRKTLGVEAAKNYDRIRQLCPEILALEVRIESYLKAH
jgi:hypothetical protein